MVSHYEPLTPVQVESRLRAFVTELSKAQQALANARDAEVDAEVALAQMRDEMSEMAPRVERGVTTVDERKDFLDRATRKQQIELLRAKAEREKAQEYLRVVRDQAEIVRSLGASVRTAYEMAGVG